MAKSKTETATTQQSGAPQYIRETRGELRKVTWPTREESWRLTWIVVGVTIALTAYLTLFDTIFSRLIGWIVDLVA